MNSLSTLFPCLLIAALLSGCSSPEGSQSANPAVNSVQYLQQANSSMPYSDDRPDSQPPEVAPETVHAPDTVGPWLTNDLPTLLSSPQPDYPPFAKSAGIEARVVVQFVVTTKGEVVKAAIKQSTDHRFDEYALSAVKKWHFRPAFRQGRPVNCRMVIPVVFTLSM